MSSLEVQAASRAQLRVADQFILLNASTSSPFFNLQGGQYGVVVNATFGGGSVELDILSADGSTLVAAVAPFTVAGTVLVTLPPGRYRFTVATATIVYASITRVPVNPGD